MKKAGLTILLLTTLPCLGQTEPTKPAPLLTASAAPVSAAPRSLADVARERVRGKGNFSAADSTAPRIPSAGTSLPNADKAATEAQRQMERAIRDGAWTERNIHYHEGIKQQARNEWDSAAEICRKTPGCVPVYRDSAEVDGVKPLRTRDEIGRDLKKRLGASIDVASSGPNR